MIGRRYVAILGMLGAVFGCSVDEQNAKTGALYSVDDGEGRYVVAKVLGVENGGVHVRLYKNKFQVRPERVEFKSLSLGTIHDKDGFGMGHLPVTHGQFRAWRPVFISDSAVEEGELEGYREWQRGKGGFFGN
jgi:hypothetical protein